MPTACSTYHRQLGRLRAGTWPRVFAQAVATGEIFEFTRGERLTTHSFAALVVGFGADWVVWQEHRAEHYRRGRLT